MNLVSSWASAVLHDPGATAEQLRAELFDALKAGWTMEQQFQHALRELQVAGRRAVKGRPVSVDSPARVRLERVLALDVGAGDGEASLQALEAEHGVHRKVVTWREPGKRVLGFRHPGWKLNRQQAWANEQRFVLGAGLVLREINARSLTELGGSPFALPEPPRWMAPLFLDLLGAGSWPS